MDDLQAVTSYWLDCIKSESALEQSFGINSKEFGLVSRTRANLFEDHYDPFIFSDYSKDYVASNRRLVETVNRAKLKGQDIYYGYPLLMYYDVQAKKNRVAPLFVIRLNVEEIASQTVLSVAETYPTLGSNAFNRLGLQPEEIAALNSEIVEIFEANKSSKLQTILYLLKKETKLTFVEGIDPDNLSPSTFIHPYRGSVIYNKSIIYVSEASIFNLHLLNDLEKLCKRNDLKSTALSFINTPSTVRYATNTPVLPYDFDEHQLLAIRAILGSQRTVVTGPPGTGKSQFIANLIINLFLEKKKVLFVSHTSEAVRVVNDRINKEFVNLMMQTGKKETRQELGRRLEQMVESYNDQQATNNPGPTLKELVSNWKDLEYQTDYLTGNNRLHKRIENILKTLEVHEERHTFKSQLFCKILSLKMKLQTQRSKKRRKNREVLGAIAKIKQNHIQLSKSYVKSNYLDLILGNDLYGQLLAYIDAVQNKKISINNSDQKSEKYIPAALQAMNVWSCTLKSLAATFPLKPNLFDYVIFDEASQIDLPSAAPALYRAKNLVVVGDENQLNHIAKINSQLEEELAEKYDLGKYDFYPSLVRYTDVSLFNSSKRSLNEPERELKNHYRSNSLIANLFSSVFYAGRLKIYEPEPTLPDELEPGVSWVDVRGTVYKYKSGSKYNPGEAAKIILLLKNLIPKAVECNLTIGITTPYSKQQEIIEKAAKATFSEEAMRHVKILTVHKFQGSEVDILIFSPVLAQKGDGNSDYWYIKNKQLLNVAVSRAKQLLLIVGDLTYSLQSESKLKDVAEYCKKLNETEELELPNRPLNPFERRMLDLLKKNLTKSFKIEPQFVINNRFTVDFALVSKRKKIAVELDGAQHEIIGGLPVFEDKQRDKYLSSEGWKVIRISVHSLLKRPESVSEMIRSAVGVR